MKTARELIKELLSEGHTIEETKSILSNAPYAMDEETFKSIINDSEFLQEIIDQSNKLILHAWGTMWKSIKSKAMIGSIQHAKLLIEFITNNNKLPGNELKVTWEETTRESKDNDNQAT